jgi:hypothetical protein
VRLAALALLGLIGCKDTPPPPAPVPAAKAADAQRSALDEAASVGSIEAWDAAAKQLAATVAACTTATPTCRQAARDAVTARGQALKLEFSSDPGSPMTPVALPARATALIAACDAYAKLAETADPELPAIELVAARLQASYGWRDLAIPRYEEILREHRDSDAAGLAVAPLLDALRRQGRGADLRRWVDSLRADTKFVSAHPDLRELLESLHALP